MADHVPLADDQSTLAGLLTEEAPAMDAIERHLDGLDHATRVAQVVALGKTAQRRLFDAAEGYKPIRVADFVPEGSPPLAEVTHHGKNSLWAFTRFAKVFCRPDDPEAHAAGELWGFNRTSGLVTTAVGPGYYVACDHGEGEVLIDYLRLPPGKPEHWPPILDNAARLSYFVYNGTQDVMRGVSEHVTIGRAMRHGRDLPNWFILCREDPASETP